MGTCDYCGKLSSVLECNCPHCEKVWYCNESHMKRHRPSHEPLCFPAFVQDADGCGRFWVANRDIPKGELIFSENALVIGPNSEHTSYSALYPTCLGCCRTTNTSTSCSKCSWPVCSKKCEKIAQHADFECKVFRKNKVHSSARPQYYLYVQFLRGLLLKNVNPQAFQKMMELESHCEPRNHHKEESQITKSFYKFLTEDCNMSQYEFDFIDKIVGVNRINSYSADVLNTNSKKRACSALFYQMSLLNHSCLPNTRTVIYENPDLSLKLGLFSSVKIFKGQCITQQYFPIVKGTNVRRKALKEWFFDCACKRCSDPTEFGTFFSCFKCHKCEDGFICPVDSLDVTSDWICSNNFENGCDALLEAKKVETLTINIETEIQKNEYSIQSLEKILEQLLISEKRLHIHHYLAINAQYEILHKIVKGLNNYREGELCRRGVGYCRNILKVVNIICPGHSYYRGVILYFIINCLFALHEMGELNKSDDCTIEELKKLIDEGIEIMEIEPEGSIYREMAEELETYRSALKS